MTQTARRNITRQIGCLRADRKAWLTGQPLHWGQPWCHGPGSLYCEGDGCIGCASVAWCGDRAAEIGEQIGHLEALLAPVVQGALW
jgi:hypothetical protein